MKRSKGLPVPRTHKKPKSRQKSALDRLGMPMDVPVIGLVYPEFPYMMETELAVPDSQQDQYSGFRTDLLSPDADHAPAIENKYPNHYDIEHGLGAQLIALLYKPEAPNTDELCGNPDDKKIREGKRIVGDHRILKRSNDSDSGIEGITKNTTSQSASPMSRQTGRRNPHKYPMRYSSVCLSL